MLEKGLAGYIVIGVMLLIPFSVGLAMLWEVVHQITKKIVALKKGQEADTFTKQVEKAFIQSKHVVVIGAYYLLFIGVILSAGLFTFIPGNWLYITFHISADTLFLVRCFMIGGLGAITYGILWLSKSKEEVKTAWYPRRFVLLPPLGSLLGGASYLFIKAGLLTLSGGASSAPETDPSKYAIYSIAFLAGFSSRELTQKLIQISEAVFARVPDPQVNNAGKTGVQSTNPMTDVPEGD